MKQLVVAATVAASVWIAIPSDAASKVVCPKGSTCCYVSGGDGGNFPPITGPIPVLNYEINDALMTAFDALQTSNPTAYTALADTLSKLPLEKRNALSGGLGLEIKKDSVSTSSELKLMVQMNRSMVQNFTDTR